MILATAEWRTSRAGVPATSASGGRTSSHRPSRTANGATTAPATRSNGR